MKRTILFVILMNSVFANAEEFGNLDCDTQKFFTDFEVNHMANAVWKYRVLTLLDQNRLDEAKQTILATQSSDIYVLDQLKAEGKLSQRSTKSLQTVKDYNQSREQRSQKRTEP